jgi:hypothetical protein
LPRHEDGRNRLTQWAGWQSAPRLDDGNQDLHLHGFDQSNVVAIIKAGASLHGEGATRPATALISGMPTGFLLWVQMGWSNLIYKWN